MTETCSRKWKRTLDAEFVWTVLASDLLTQRDEFASKLLLALDPALHH
jgi:hypothetical protein